MKTRFIFLALAAAIMAVVMVYAQEPDVPVSEPTPAVEYDNIVQTVRYELTDEEREAVEMCVMAESGAEPYCGQMAVAQCLLNLCEAREDRPVTVISDCFTEKQAEPTESVIEAVSAVFDRGEVALRDTPMYFYAPAVCESDWHESQRYITTIGGHRFFGEV